MFPCASAYSLCHLARKKLPFRAEAARENRTPNLRFTKPMPYRWTMAAYCAESLITQLDAKRFRADPART